ncbi:MAG: 16S rRNA (adenine(1518)-N(6)/adenine(1519)-N(6))-dimethyltransferase RsmA [Pseudomonadota bacterium]
MTALEDLPPLRDVIHDYGLAAKKTLGQNFLLDLNLTRKIARVAKLTPEMHVIEIGPGPGGLTRALLEQDIRKLTAIERDERCIKALQAVVKASNGRLDLQSGDALTVDVTAMTAPPRAVVANLPYNIATPLLIGWLRQISAFSSLTLMFQKEVALRIIAAPGTKAYGRLSVISQWLCDCDIAFDVPASAFTPPPKITSSIVRFLPRTLAADQPRFETIEKITALAFQQRRKMLRQSLKTLVPDIKTLLAAAEIAETARADALPVSAYIHLARLYEERPGS